MFLNQIKIGCDEITLMKDVRAVKQNLIETFKVMQELVRVNIIKIFLLVGEFRFSDWWRNEEEFIL